jgi:hypothetical protein
MIVDYLIYAVVIISFLFWLWGRYEDSANEAKCPNCNKLWAAVNTREELIGVFRKNHLPPIRLRGHENSPKMAWFEKYKIHYKCKYCGHEWTVLKSKKQ